jgi:DNA-binding NarL/FixJ family response regulator
MSIRVLLVDDEQLIRAGLRVIVDAEPDLGQADDGTEGPSPVARSRPDVVLMDVRMPSVDGIRVTGHLISTMDWTPKIIMVTMFEKASTSTMLCAPAARLRTTRIVLAGTVLRGPHSPSASGRYSGLSPVDCPMWIQAVSFSLASKPLKTHVGNVLAKLGARDRTQAVIKAYESGFIRPTG